MLLTAQLRIAAAGFDGGRIAATAADDTIVTRMVCHAPEGLAKCIALGVDGAKAYTTVA
jgi:hypothetical protein